GGRRRAVRAGASARPVLDRPGGRAPRRTEGRRLMTDNGTGESASGRLCAVSEFWELPGDPALCPGLRRRVRASLTGFPHTAADAELFANACRHSLSGDGGKVSVSLSGLRTGLVLVTVT